MDFSTRTVAGLPGVSVPRELIGEMKFEVAFWGTNALLSGWSQRAVGFVCRGSIPED